MFESFEHTGTVTYAFWRITDFNSVKAIHHVKLGHPVDSQRFPKSPRDRWYMDTLGSSAPSASKPKPCPISVFSISWISGKRALNLPWTFAQEAWSKIVLCTCVPCVHMQYVHIYIYSICVYVCICIYVYVYMYMYICMCDCVCVCKYKHAYILYVCVRICIYIYTYMHMHKCPSICISHHISLYLYISLSNLSFFPKSNVAASL